MIIPRYRIPHWSLVATILLFLTSAIVILTAPPGLLTRLRFVGFAGAANGIGTDPLTTAETRRATAAAEALYSVSAAALRTAEVAPGGAVVSAPAESILLVERKLQGKGSPIAASGSVDAAPRQADIFLYRYADDVLVHAVHDLRSGQTVVVEEARGVQLPLTEDERSLATEIAFGDPALLALLQDEYRAIVGQELTGPEQVDVRAFVYRSGAAPEIEPPEASTCGMQRCAQLLILTPNDVTLSILPIVNLSTLRTASVVPLAVTNSAPAATDGESQLHGNDENGNGGQP